MSVTPVVTPAPSGEQDWRAGLPEEIRSDKSLESFKGIADVAKGFIETKKMMGSAIKLPKADAPDTEWEPIYSKLGRPESADKYEFKRPENLPTGTAYDEELENSMRPIFHKAGLSPRQVQMVYDGFMGIGMSRYEKSTSEKSAAQEAASVELKKKWGGDYDKNLGLAQRAVKELGGDEETVKYLIESGIGNDHKLLPLFAKAGALLGEAPFIIGDANGGEEQSAALDAKLDEARAKASNEKLPHREREAAIAEYTALSKRRYSAAQ